MSAQEGGSDAQAAAEAVEGQKLLRLTDASGQMQLIVEQSGTLYTRKLEPARTAGTLSARTHRLVWKWRSDRTRRGAVTQKAGHE